MSIEVKVPVLPESVADATVATWHKKVGDKVSRDENILDLETDKVMLEVPAVADGILTDILFQEGSTVKSGDLLAKIDTNGKASGASQNGKEETKKTGASESKAPTSTTKSNDLEEKSATKDSESFSGDKSTSPGVRRLLAENGLEPSQIRGSGKEGRITKDDVVGFIESQRQKSTTGEPEVSAGRKESQTSQTFGEREEKRVPMTRLRAKVAERLVQAQHDAAMLTTFNEVNLQAIMDLRSHYKNDFEKKHGVKLGFMSFFTKAVVEALKLFPAVNASIDGQDIVYHGFFDVGIAVSTERGLVVPVVRDADQKSMAEIEQTIADFAARARQNKLSLEEIQGGTFTITNGGVFGSLLATPIINPPQTAILGMHAIQQRPIAENGQVVIRPMMYVALSYDHRLIDGKDSVQFLVTVKQFLEDPTRLLLSV